MPHEPQRERRPITRADLPVEFTPETLRHVDIQTLGRFARHGNGVLSPEEQHRFDQALSELRHSTNSLIEQSLERAQRGGPENLDPAMRRSYARAQARLAQQARRAAGSFPGTLDLPSLPPMTPPPATEPPAEPEPSGEPSDQASPADETTEDVSPAVLTSEVEQTSDTLDMLERIASLQQEQVEHQHNQLLSETRGLFFAFLVSVAVIVAGVAPLVDETPDERLLTIGWTLAVIAAAGLVYAIVRAQQVKKE